MTNKEAINAVDVIEQSIDSEPQDDLPTRHSDCPKCGGKGYVVVGNGEDYECDECLIDYQPENINRERGK